MALNIVGRDLGLQCPVPDDAIESCAQVNSEAGNALLKRIEISLNGSVNEAAQLIEARTDCTELLLAVRSDRQKLADVLLSARLERRIAYLQGEVSRCLPAHDMGHAVQQERYVHDGIQGQQSSFDKGLTAPLEVCGLITRIFGGARRLVAQRPADVL